VGRAGPPVQSERAPPPSRTDEQRRVRYNHLVERLRGRQITMEEATELFGLMQGMLRASEAARAALMAAAAPPGEPKPHPPAGMAARGGTLPATDDMIMAGMLAMGAGAGLLAAITKRMNEGPPPGKAPSRGRPETRPSSP
jgi:hypothetical protein